MNRMHGIGLHGIGLQNCNFATSFYYEEEEEERWLQPCSFAVDLGESGAGGAAVAPE